MLLKVAEVLARCKQAVQAYRDWVATGDISAHRACPACGRFRHRHGWATRFVVCGDWEEQLACLRLLCSECGTTETLLPEWLRPHSPYPWPLQEAAVLAYVGGPAGYRPVAALFGVDYTVLWGWTRPLAVVAVALVAAVVRDLLEQDPGADVDLRPVDHGGMLRKAWTAEKRQGLAHLPLLARAAVALRAAYRRRAGAPGGEEGAGALGWLSRYLRLHGVAPRLWIGSHRRPHSVPAAAPP